jgi:hypothetical protein
VATKPTDEQECFIVASLAYMMTPGEVVAALKDEFALELSRDAVRRYDPEVNPDLDDSLRSLFFDTRQAFQDGTLQLRVRNRAYRLARLDALSIKAERGGQLALARQLLEQAAREEGGHYAGKQSSPDAGAAFTVLMEEWRARTDARRARYLGETTECESSQPKQLEAASRDSAPSSAHNAARQLSDRHTKPAGRHRR